MRISSRIGIVPLACAFMGILLILGCGSSKPLFQSVVPEMEAFTSGEVPLRFDQGYPYLVFHSGKDSVELFLDTGAGQVGVGLLPETARSLGLLGFGRTRTIKTNSGRIKYKRVILPEAHFGGVTFRNLICDQVNADAHPLFVRRGIMGLALLRRFNVLIDYLGSRLVLSHQGRYPADFDSSSWKQIPFTDHPDGILIDGVPEGISKNLRWCLDTGAVARDPERTEYYNLLKSKYFRGMSGAKERDGWAFARLRVFRSAGVSLDSLNFLAHDFGEPGGVDGFLGADFFMKHRVLVDFADAVLWIQPCR